MIQTTTTTTQERCPVLTLVTRTPRPSAGDESPADLAHEISPPLRVPAPDFGPDAPTNELRDPVLQPDRDASPIRGREEVERLWQQLERRGRVKEGWVERVEVERVVPVCGARVGDPVGAGVSEAQREMRERRTGGRAR